MQSETVPPQRVKEEEERVLLVHQKIWIEELGMTPKWVVIPLVPRIGPISLICCLGGPRFFMNDFL